MEFLQQLLKESVVAAALLAVVILFLRQQRMLSKTWMAQIDRYYQTSTEETKLCREAIERCTMTHGELISVLREARGPLVGRSPVRVD